MLSFILSFLHLSLLSLGQLQDNAQITGTALDEAGLVYANVSLTLVSVDTTASGTPKLSTQTRSDDQGNFHFTALPFGEYLLTVRYIGYKTQQLPVFLSQDKPIENLQVTLIEEYQIIEDIIVFGKSETQQIKEQAIRSVVMDIRAVAEQPATLAELMNRSPGVRIRQTGGLGSSADISLSGFQGKSIRYFRDGIPMDYLGESFSIGSLPVNMLERIEIYKGVLPTHLGADALGGAVNMITHTQQQNQLRLSYEGGSFNTHRLNLNAYYNNASNTYFTGLDAYFNHSDNDYKAKVMVTDPETRNQTQENLPLFHNAYTSRFIQVYGGLKNRTWADELKLELSYFHMDREIQHPTLMNESYGAMTAAQHTFIPAIRYKKNLGKVRFDQFFVYNQLINERTDSLRNGGYDWYGNFIPKVNTLGESRAQSLSHTNTSIFTSRSNIAYQINDNHHFEFNAVYTNSDRSGRDPIGPKINGTDIDVLTLPSTYSKLAGSLGFKSIFLNRNLEHQLIAKYYRYDAKGYEVYHGRGVDETDNKSTSGSYFGIADALKYTLSDRDLFRFSAEYAYRLPDFEELFGNGVFIVQNFLLKPEKSLNLNAGYRFESPNKFTAEANAFYRITNDMLLLVPIISPYARYENQQDVKGFGIELDATARLFKNLQLTANASWQELRLYKLTGTDSWKNGSRLRNTPYMFGNTGLTYTLPRTFSSASTLKVYGFYNYIKEFYLEPISKDLEAKGLFGKASINSLLVIPTQHFISGGASYTLPHLGVSFGVEAKNILNKDLYDNFRVQRAGRSLHFKINYNLIKQNKL